MAANVEIKARVNDPEKLRARALEIADTEPEWIRQRDTFFKVPTGRLKLREFGDGTAELIRYSRPDRSGPKVSDYSLFATDNPGGLLEVLEPLLGTLGVVVKERILLLVGRTRIHLDQVEGLGSFMELEVVLGEGETIASGEIEARRLMDELGIQEEDLIEGAYLDLLRKGES